MGEVRFMISEAAKQVDVESHVLRYWEEELGLKIGRTEMGHRYYTNDDIRLFRCIKKLKDEGMLLRELKPLIPELREAAFQYDMESQQNNRLSRIMCLLPFPFARACSDCLSCSLKSLTGILHHTR